MTIQKSRALLRVGWTGASVGTASCLAAATFQCCSRPSRASGRQTCTRSTGTPIHALCPLLIYSTLLYSGYSLIRFESMPVKSISDLLSVHSDVSCALGCELTWRVVPSIQSTRVCCPTRRECFIMFADSGRARSRRSWSR